MKTRLENNERAFRSLHALASGYSTGDFNEFFQYLSQDCVFESQWVMTPNVGYEAVTGYLSEKGRTLKNSGSFPNCSVIELVGNINSVENAQSNANGRITIGSIGLLYVPGKLCLLVEQRIDDKTNGVIADITLDDAGLIKRVDLCMPELFNYRRFYTDIVFVPATEERENTDAMFHISESYYDELYLFLGAVGVKFNEYDDSRIPMDKWCEALKKWKCFAEEKSFDEAYERICGINYSDWSVTDNNAARMLNRDGQRMWEERYTNTPMLDGLIEWTQEYGKEYSFINSYGA